MKAVFVELPAFERNRSNYLDDAAFHALQTELLKNPDAGDIIIGSGDCESCASLTLAAARVSAVGFASFISGGWLAGSFGFTHCMTRVSSMI